MTMIRAYRAELYKLARPLTVLAVAVVALFGVLSNVLVFALADDGPPVTPGEAGFSITLGQLAAARGGVAGFSAGMTFVGLLTFMMFIVLVTMEYGQGTLRTQLLREPRRAVWLGGKVAALMSVLAVALLAALGASLLTAVAMGQARGVDMSAWWTADGIAEIASGYVNALLACAFFGLAGTALGILVRSTAIALAVGFAWMFPLEHIIAESWTDANQVFPGLLFAVVSAGGRTAEAVPYDSALLAAAVYVAVFAAVGVASITRRDVTA
jgi:hypothetical protein